MQDLRLIGVHEDGEHLLLAGDGEERFRLPIDDALRSGVRPPRPAREPAAAQQDGSLRPRDVQALIRGGASAEEAAELAGWPVDKVHRYEGPILAEREHVAGLARTVTVRGRSHGGGASVQTVEARVSARLADRGVPADAAQWDAWRRETGPWTVVATFPAGGRERRASWQFDPADRTLTALDDEARWLSGDEKEPVGGPIPTTPGPRRRTRVYDVEAEGGLRASDRAESGARPDTVGAQQEAERAGGPAHRRESASSGEAEAVDLMTAMRERSAARGRRGRRSKRKTAPPSSPAHVPGADDAPEDALPLEEIAYDPETMPPPPGAHVPPEPVEASAETLPSEDTTDGEEAADSVDPVDPAATPAATYEEPGLFDTEVTGERDDIADDAPAPAQEDDAVEQPAAADEEPRHGSSSRRSTRRSGRPSVPSWDDIMFGAPRGEA